MEKIKTQEVQSEDEIESIAKVFYRDNATQEVKMGFVAGVRWQQSLISDKYPLTKEQIIKLVGDAFDVANTYEQMSKRDQKAYIETLFK